jgi:hypothetical protein
VRAERGKENRLPPSASLPQKWKKVYKGSDHGQEQQAHPPTPIDRTPTLPPTLHFFSTNHQEHPRTPRKKDKKRMHRMSKLLEKDKAVMN